MQCNIEGNLYYSQISPDLLAIITREIDALDTGKAHRWEDRSGLRRITFEFGISFKELEENQREVTIEMPDFLVATRNKLVELFKNHLSEKNPEKYTNCIVTEYSEGDGIKEHTDRDYFGPDVLGLVVQPDGTDSPSSLQFFKPGSGERISLVEQPGTAFLFQGELRTAWKHELKPVATKRIAIQFRTVNYRPKL